MERFKIIFAEHYYIAIYLAIFCSLIIGLTWIQAYDLLFNLLLYFLLPFIAVYMLLRPFKNFNFPSFTINFQPFTSVLAILSIGLLVSHLLTIGQIPIYLAFKSNIQSEINQLRTSIAEASSGIWTYLYAWNLKAFLPFLLLLLFHKKKYWLLLILGLLASFYAAALLQKSHIIWIWAPSLVYAVFNRNWIFAFSYASLVLITLTSLVWVTNARLRGGINDVSTVVNTSSSSAEISGGLMRRIFVVPSEIIYGWYNTIPDKKPFLYGKDFGIYCKLTKQPCSDYAKELYPILYPEYAERGLTGSVNAAHFMRSYANFGNFGFFLAALLMNFVLLSCKLSESKRNRKVAFAIHFFPLALTGSGSIFTLMLSGGWVISILLLLIYRNEFEPQ